MRWGGRPRILFVGSGLVYGDAETAEQMFDESCLLRPTSPYAASKAAADLRQLSVRPRPWPRHCARAAVQPHRAGCSRPVSLSRTSAKQIAAISLGQTPPVWTTGNLASRRDFTDVRDVVRAYVLLVERGRRGEVYNLGSGQTVSMREIVDRLVALAGVKIDVQTASRFDPRRRYRRVAAPMPASCAAKPAGRRRSPWSRRSATPWSTGNSNRVRPRAGDGRDLHENRSHRHRLRRPGNGDLPGRERQRRGRHRQGCREDRAARRRRTAHLRAGPAGTGAAQHAARVGCASRPISPAVSVRRSWSSSPSARRRATDGGADLSNVWAVGDAVGRGHATGRKSSSSKAPSPSAPIVNWPSASRREPSIPATWPAIPSSSRKGPPWTTS